MKVFISWSGELSRRVAEILRGWLPNVNQKLDTFVSSQDIEMGSRWEEGIAGQLAGTHCGILCLTPQNREKPWVLFEAGALSKDPLCRVSARYSLET